MRNALHLALLVATGCGPDGPRLCETRTSLIDHASFVLLPPADDPFAPAGPGGRGPCTERDVHYELFELEPSVTVDTLACSWTTVQWSAAEPVAAGEPLNVRIWYFSQETFEVAEAELLLAAGDDPFWRATVPLPAVSGGLLATTLPAPADVATGAPLRWHLGNHGANTYNLIELTVARTAPCAAE